MYADLMLEAQNMFLNQASEADWVSTVDRT